MFALERQKRILDQLKEQGSVTVSKLSVQLGVTEETIRRDLEKLEKQEALLRTHGGAVPLDENKQEFSLERRKKINQDIKQTLAKEAVTFIMPGDTIFIDASTTAFYMAQELKGFHGITVITNSLRVATELCGLPDIKLILVGGMVSMNQSLVGSMAESNIQNHYFVNKMFFSSRGISTAGILESNEQECFIKQSMMKNATLKYYLCDKGKFGRVGFVKLARLEDIQYLITEDGAVDEELQAALQEYKVKVVTV